MTIDASDPTYYSGDWDAALAAADAAAYAASNPGARPVYLPPGSYTLASTFVSRTGLHAPNATINATHGGSAVKLDFTDRQPYFPFTLPQILGSGTAAVEIVHMIGATDMKVARTNGFTSGIWLHPGANQKVSHNWITVGHTEEHTYHFHLQTSAGGGSEVWNNVLRSTRCNNGGVIVQAFRCDGTAAGGSDSVVNNVLERATMEALTGYIASPEYFAWFDGCANNWMRDSHVEYANTSAPYTERRWYTGPTAISNGIGLGATHDYPTAPWFGNFVQIGNADASNFGLGWGALHDMSDDPNKG